MTKRQIAYFILCIVGTSLPCSQLVPFLREHGLNLQMMIQQLFENRISSFFGIDVVVTTFVLWLFVYIEGTRLRMRRLWIYVICSLLVGVSLGLPLFLLMRQSKAEVS